MQNVLLNSTTTRNLKLFYNVKSLSMYRYLFITIYVSFSLSNIPTFMDNSQG